MISEQIGSSRSLRSTFDLHNITRHVEWTAEDWTADIIPRQPPITGSVLLCLLLEWKLPESIPCRPLTSHSGHMRASLTGAVEVWIVRGLDNPGLLRPKRVQLSSLARRRQSTPRRPPLITYGTMTGAVSFARALAEAHLNSPLQTLRH